MKQVSFVLHKKAYDGLQALKPSLRTNDVMLAGCLALTESHRHRNYSYFHTVIFIIESQRLQFSLSLCVVALTSLSVSVKAIHASVAVKLKE